MNNTVYTINKGINRPLQFKGLKAQYIWYLGGGLLGLLILFTILYICGVPSLVCLGLIAILGTILFLYIYRLSHRYGPYGLMKKTAKQRIPRSLINNTRKTFTTLCRKS